jgi:hypothetical protein
LPAAGLRVGELDERCAHLCIDMQRIFSEATPWQVNWLPGSRDAMVDIYCERFQMQIEAVNTGMILQGWNGS